MKTITDNVQSLATLLHNKLAFDLPPQNRKGNLWRIFIKEWKVQ
jgi:hypothetical protein